MTVPPSVAWKLVLAIALGAGILASAYAHAPRRSVPGSELRRLVLAALSLYAVGGLASLTHHPVLAGVVYAAGIITCALAAWLSRGSDSEDPPDGQEPVDEQPPPEPDGIPSFDWAQFERELHDYSERRRDPSGVS
jgi:sugar (pentulose or hexulose) kinase